MTTVIFDLDGTLADTSADLIAAANACFEGLGHGARLDPKEDKLTAFHGGRAMLRLGFSRLEGGPDEAMVTQEYPKFLDHYARNIDRFTKLYPGCKAALQRLKDAGHVLGVCTNKPEGLAEALLERLGVRAQFSSLVGADTTAHSKPHSLPYLESVQRAGGSPDTSVLLGDTETDVKTARAAGVPVVLVAFGPEGDAVARLNPDALLEHYDRLDAVLDGLASRQI